jgi:hypothetical protein
MLGIFAKHGDETSRKLIAVSARRFIIDNLRVYFGLALRSVSFILNLLDEDHLNQRLVRDIAFISESLQRVRQRET